MLHSEKIPTWRIFAKKLHESIKRNGFNDEALILITLPIALLVQAYVVRGLIVQHPNIVWGVLIGWFCGYVKKEED